jgi:putative hydrolase of the HAD superfamily
MSGTWMLRNVHVSVSFNKTPQPYPDLMRELPRNDHWYLFDYGMVISTAPEEADWDALEEAAGVELRDPSSFYWKHRLDFDEGKLSSCEYWSLALQRRVSIGLANQLDALDANQWSHINLDTLDVLEALNASGAQLALLSNMPAGMAEQFSSAPWTKYFAQLFFSSRIGMVKPDPRVFHHVLAVIGAQPDQVIFVDDKEANIASARSLGIRTVHHLHGIDLQSELSSLQPLPL